MSYSGDAAEQVVRMSLETGEVAVRLAGSGAKQLAILIYAIPVSYTHLDVYKRQTVITLIPLFLTPR